jgi:hypothetical protein
MTLPMPPGGGVASPDDDIERRHRRIFSGDTPVAA